MDCCCTDSAPSPPSLPRRALGLTQWALPSALLALMPKCPMCLAAYIALGTGLGIPLSAATVLRTSLIVLCIASLTFLTTRFLYRRFYSRISP